MFRETIAPLLLVENTALIGITTPMEDTCDYSQMMSMTHQDGSPMFNTISITLMCDACRKARLLECPHLAHEIPAWKRDKKRGRLVQSIMAGDKKMYLRENAGVVSASTNNAFHIESIDALLNKETYDIARFGNVRPPVFVCIDTAGGGASCTAVCSGIYTKSHSLLVSCRYKCTYRAAIAPTKLATERYLASVLRTHLDVSSRCLPVKNVSRFASRDANHGSNFRGSHVLA